MGHGFRFIGLTGGIGSGKSSVAKILMGLGLEVISADAVVHELLSEDDLVKRAIRSRFGAGVFDKQGQVIRKKLGEKIFSADCEREWLENLLHPKVRQKVQKAKDQAHQRKAKALFYEVPLLFEKGLQDQFDEIWLIKAPEKVRISRVQARDDLGPAEIQKRIRAQIPDPIKEVNSEVVIHNNSSMEELTARVLQICKDRGLDSA
jgi:dephospho-CoA kinase